MTEKIGSEYRVLNVGDCELPRKISPQAETQMETLSTVRIDFRSVGGVDERIGRMISLSSIYRQDGDVGSRVNQKRTFLARVVNEEPF